MKALNIYFTILLLLAGMSGCNDGFMEKYPPDKINDQTFWKTVDDLKSYANQFYTGAVLNAVNNYQRDNASDNQAHMNKDSYIWNESTVPTSGGGWAKGDWSGIRNCNFFLQRYHTVVDAGSSINTYVGEVLFFKAAFYYEKLQQFGDVPWLTEDLSTSSEELYAPKNSRAEVTDSIIACLDRAIAFLPETSADGRLTSYTALAFKARVCLFEGTFRKYHGPGDYERILRQSADAAQRIISSGRFELYSTGNPQDDYHAFFQLLDMTGVKEAIFFVRYEADKRQHNRVRETRESGSGMTKDFVESFLCRTDGQPISLSGDYGGDATFMDEFENRDYRMKQIIYTPDRPIFITENGTEEYEESPIYTNLSYTGYRMYKTYSPLAADNEYIKCTIDDCPFRYGEV
ncbi:MAG: RagB/SusD family nutrient uptake outer membrane protein, partial [Tannerella sp.]|nr:RagB/SusD family nutrient uptake outer membrane protein [Tannerella sp.]